MYASGSALDRMAVERLGDAFRGPEVTAAARQGDDAALGVLDEFGYWLALGISNLCILTDPEMVVIGGGLSGLAACYELEKRGAAYTVIEVKPRFGGGIRSVLEAGFIMDASAFAFRPLLDHTLLNDLSLRQRVVPIDDEACVFRDGSASLIRALEARLQGGRLMRMAVSSIGRLGERFTICFENGIMLDAGALTYFGIIAGAIFTGSVVIETVFVWPGTGLLAIEAIRARDYPVVQAVVLTFAVGFILANLIVDTLYAYLDPRIRYS